MCMQGIFRNYKISDGVDHHDAQCPVTLPPQPSDLPTVNLLCALHFLFPDAGDGISAKLRGDRLFSMRIRGKRRTRRTGEG